MKNYFEIMKQLAEMAHQGQFRRDGVTPYITHPQAVANSVSERAKPVAIAHDAWEDCPELAEILDALSLITKRQGDDYFEYIQRIKSNPLAREVKIADIKHNLASNPKEKTIEKYRKALEILENRDA